VIWFKVAEVTPVSYENFSIKIPADLAKKLIKYFKRQVGFLHATSRIQNK
jgi:hypothetical protein